MFLDLHLNFKFIPAGKLVEATAAALLKAQPDLASDPLRLAQALAGQLPGAFRVAVRRTLPAPRCADYHCFCFRGNASSVGDDLKG